MSGVFEHLDEVVERLASLRDELLADEFAPDRAARLAAVFESEARGVVAGLRAVAPAADLAGGAGRRGRRAGERGAVGARAPPRSGPAGAGQSWAAGRVGAPRPAALTTSERGGGR